MLTIRLPVEMQKRLDALASETGRSRSDLAREAIAAFLERRCPPAHENAGSSAVGSFGHLARVWCDRTGGDLTGADLVALGLVEAGGNAPTGAGLLFMDDCPVRHSRLFCTRWNGLDKAGGLVEALDDQEYEGPLTGLLQHGMDFVTSNSKKRWSKTRTGRIEMPDYPPEAVREVLVNALIHRDYAVRGSEVHIDIFDDRLEVFSPGGVPGGFAVPELEAGQVEARRRNPDIAHVFECLRLTGPAGKGLAMIRSRYRAAVNHRPEAEPRFVATASAFFAVLPNLNYGVSLEQAAENVLRIERAQMAADGESDVP